MDAVKVIKKSGAPGAVPAVTAYVDEPLLPKVSAEDSGKVIGVDENGELEAVTIPVPESKKYYKHDVYLLFSFWGAAWVTIINESSTAFTSATFKDYLNSLPWGYSLPVFPFWTLDNNNQIKYVRSLQGGRSYSNTNFNFTGGTYTFAIENGAIKISVVNAAAADTVSTTVNTDSVTEIK